MRLLLFALMSCGVLMGCDRDDVPNDNGLGDDFSSEVTVDCSEYDASSVELVARGCPCDVSDVPYCCVRPQGAQLRCVDGTWWAWVGDDWCNRWPDPDGGPPYEIPPAGVASMCEPAY